MQQAATYKLSIATSARPFAAAVWIDWNHNGLFDSAEYKLIPFPTDSTHADTTIDVPSNATLGFVMMRFRI